LGNGCCTIDAPKLIPAKLVTGGDFIYRPATIAAVVAGTILAPVVPEGSICLWSLWSKIKGGGL
jgi:hypothetical protein